MFCLTPVRKVAKCVIHGTCTRCFPCVSGCFAPFVPTTGGVDGGVGQSLTTRGGRRVQLIPRLVKGHTSRFLVVVQRLRRLKFADIGLGFNYPSKAIISGEGKTKFLTSPGRLRVLLRRILRGDPLTMSMGAEIKVGSPSR